MKAVELSQEEHMKLSSPCVQNMSQVRKIAFNKHVVPELFHCFLTALK